VTVRWVAVLTILASWGCGRYAFEDVAAPPDAGAPACERGGYPDVPWLLDEGYPTEIAAIDLDGDGALDLAAVDGSQILVYLGRGDATFGPVTRYPSLDGLLALATGDFDGDSALDLAAVSSASNALAIWWGRGDGTLEPEVRVPIDSVPHDVVATDVDGDGHPELVTAEAAGLTLWRSQSGRTFSPSTVLSGEDELSLVTANLDGDGVPDLVALPSSGLSVTTLHGRGDGTFTAPVSTPFIASYPFFVVSAGDLDADGLDDVVIADLGTTVIVLANRGGDTFAAQQDYPTTGDVGHEIAIGDVDRDGANDVLVADQGEDIVTLMHNRGDGTFDLRDLHAGTQPISLALADLDRDGRLDLVAGIIHGLSILLGADDSFDQPLAYPIDHSTYALVVADLDGDGMLDALATGLARSTLWSGAGDGTFRDPLATEGFYYGSDVVAVDIDGDGDLDLIGGEPAMTGIIVVENRGGRTFGPAVMYATPWISSELAVLDLDGDGRPEIISGSYNTAGLRVFRNSGSGTYDAGTDLATPVATSGLATGDFTGDGRVDLLYVPESPASIAVLASNGDGTLQSPRTLNLPLPPLNRQILVGDLDTSGTLDAVVITMEGLRTVLGDGAGNFVLGPLSSAPSYEGMSQLVSLDGGPLSIVGANDNACSLDIAAGRGDGSFAPPRHYNSNGYPSETYAVDLDGKPGLEIVIGGFERLSVVRDRCP
jgi:hypothetical protein